VRDDVAKPAKTLPKAAPVAAKPKAAATGGAKRRFELVEGTSSKFWEIAVDGASYTTTYGRIGTSGQSTTKTASSPEKAQAEADKLVTEKTKKGYVKS